MVIVVVQEDGLTANDWHRLKRLYLPRLRLRICGESRYSNRCVPPVSYSIREIITEHVLPRYNLIDSFQALHAACGKRSGSRSIEEFLSYRMKLAAYLSWFQSGDNKKKSCIIAQVWAHCAHHKVCRFEDSCYKGTRRALGGSPAYW